MSYYSLCQIIVPVDWSLNMTKKTAITSDGDRAIVVVSPDEKTITTEFREEHQPTLEQMQKFVGGYIQIVYCDNGDQIIMDEEGKLKDKEPNWEATEHWFMDKDGVSLADKGIPPEEYPDIIVGDCLVLRGKARLD